MARTNTHANQVSQDSKEDGASTEGELHRKAQLTDVTIYYLITRLAGVSRVIVMTLRNAASLDNHSRTAVTPYDFFSYLISPNYGKEKGTLKDHTVLGSSKTDNTGNDWLDIKLKVVRTVVHTVRANRSLSVICDLTRH